MRSTNWKLAVILGFAGSIALSASAAEAQTARKKPANRSVASSQYAYPSSARAFYGAPVHSGGIVFGEGRMGANYNPNQ